MRNPHTLLVVSCLLLVSLASGSSIGYVQSSVSSYNFMGRSNNSTLYNLTLSNDQYEYPVYLIDLWGDRQTMGYDYGVLLGHLISECYTSVFDAIFKSAGIPVYLYPLAERAADLFLDWQWNEFLSKQVPVEYMQELDGIEQGGNAIGISGLSKLISRVITLSNLPSDLIDMQYVFENEYNSWKLQNPLAKPTDEHLLQFMRSAASKAPSGLQCSMFGVWGSRTKDGELYSARNLDWLPNLGLDQYKCIQVWHPEGAYENAAIGYVVVYGALAGMNSKGISVHEANLEVDVETFSGFPFILRLRYIMEKAANIAEGWALWEQTNNTVGYNHMIASGVDAKGPFSHAALAIETMAGYNAFFLDNDPREASAMIYDSSNNSYVPIGFPMPNALWRTNHGYDPAVRKHYMWRNMHAGQWSLERYMFAYQAFSDYERTRTLIDINDAINITAILADKGDHAYQCEDNTDGSNIISVTFHPIAQEMWAAWENGSGSSWRPACCNNYIHFDMSRWFSQRPDKN